MSDHFAESATVLVTVNLTVCRLCLEGLGGECHVPGCAFWCYEAPSVRVADVLHLHATSPRFDGSVSPR